MHHQKKNVCSFAKKVASSLKRVSQVETNNTRSINIDDQTEGVTQNSHKTDNPKEDTEVKTNCVTHTPKMDNQKQLFQHRYGKICVRFSFDFV